MTRRAKQERHSYGNTLIGIIQPRAKRLLPSKILLEKVPNATFTAGICESARSCEDYPIFQSGSECGTDIRLIDIKYTSLLHLSNNALPSLDDKFRQKMMFLGFFLFVDDHDAVTNRSKINRIVNDYKIKDKIHLIVQDNAPYDLILSVL